MSLNQFETDEQRAEALIDWLKSNGLFIVIVLVAIFGGIIGWDYYQKNQVKQLSVQATNYYQFEKVLAGGKVDDNAFNVVMKDSKSLGFKDLAVLHKAAFDANNGNITAAIADLQSQISNTVDPVMKDLFHYRLAKVFYEHKDYTAALDELSKLQTDSFKGLVKVLQGDIYAKEGRVDNAKVVYTEALEVLQTPIIQRKINQLAKES